MALPCSNELIQFQHCSVCPRLLGHHLRWRRCPGPLPVQELEEVSNGKEQGQGEVPHLR